MKIQLDTSAKTIKVEESVNLGELIAAMEKLLPNWKEFKIEPVTITAFANPIIIERREWWPRPSYIPWWQQTVATGGFQSTAGKLSPGLVSHEEDKNQLAYKFDDIPKGVFSLELK